jgi:photosystem II stability/assembly factor-like uncharacterized protein
MQETVEGTRQPVAEQARALPGSKSLARLNMFEQSRGLLETPIDVAEPDKPFMQSLTAPDQPMLAEGAAAGEDEAYTLSSYLTAFQEKKHIAMTAPSPEVPNYWRPLGPFCIPHGQTYGNARPSVAGRVPAVAVDPQEETHILIGAASGGIWETRSSGRTWYPRSDDQPTLAIGAIAFDPNNTALVYAGTGEGDFYRRLGVGLLRSTDSGTTWALHAETPFVGLGFHDLVVDPLDGNHLLAATSGNLCESNDGGITWTVRRNRWTWDISLHPAVSGDLNSTKEVFAACNDGLYRSTDGGGTWSQVNLPGAPSSFNRMEVCHAPSNGDVVYVFAAKGSNAYLWRRDTFGGDFASVEAPYSGVRAHQAWYDWCAAVAPDDHNVLYLGAIEIHKGVRSSSGAWSWSKISARSTGDSIHPDQHHITFSPTDANVVYIGNDGGIYRSPDGGTTWQSLNDGLAIAEIEYMAQHPEYDVWMLAGTQDNGTMRYEGGEVWYHAADGDGGDCGVNDASAYTCYHTFYNMPVQRSTSGGSWGSWTMVLNHPSDYDSLFYPPLEVAGSVVARAGESVFISTNNAASWTEVALPAGAGVASALAIPSPTRVIVGTTTGNIYRIDQVGGTWQAPVTLTRPRNAFVSDLLVDPTDGDRIWATYSTLGGGHVFRSDDGGNNWNDASAGLPNIAVNAIVVDPESTDIVYVGCDVGVYRSTDAGATWTDFNNGLPNAIVGDLLFHPVSRVLRAGTRSRGAWEILVDQVTLPDVYVYMRDSVVDAGFQIPSPSGGSDPFTPGATVKWHDSSDIKVDAAPFQRPLSDIDFVYFEDDKGVAQGGLKTETVQGQVHVLVQVHNGGPAPAADTTVKVFYADGSSLPPLPDGFWTDFPDNSVPASSPWKPIAEHRTVSRLENGRPQVIGFDWRAPTNTGGSVWLLALASADNDPIATTELDVTRLVRFNSKAVLKQVRVQRRRGCSFLNWLLQKLRG